MSYNWNWDAESAANLMGNPGGGFFQMGAYGQPNQGQQPQTMMPGINPSVPAPNASGRSFFNTFNKDGNIAQQGYGSALVGGLQGAAGLFMGLRQYGLYKDQLDESKKQFGVNYRAQADTTNAALNDRQRARVASNSGAYQSVGDYMSQYGIKKA